MIASLPERQREIVFLRYFADLDYRAIGGALGIEQGTVGAALNAAQRTDLFDSRVNHRQGMRVLSLGGTIFPGQPGTVRAIARVQRPTVC
jgi:hypothetical protein